MGISSFIRKVCVQTAVYWEATGNDGYGSMSYADPVEILCRWDEKTKIVTNSQGKEVVSGAQLLVTAEYKTESKVWLGTLAELEALVVNEDILDCNPANIPGTWEVISKEKTPMIHSTTEFVNTIYLAS